LGVLSKTLGQQIPHLDPDQRLTAARRRPRNLDFEAVVRRSFVLEVHLPLDIDSFNETSHAASLVAGGILLAQLIEGGRMLKRHDARRCLVGLGAVIAVAGALAGHVQAEAPQAAASGDAAGTDGEENATVKIARTPS
jgi:hypothetical protein